MIFWDNSSSNVKIQFSSQERGDSVAEQQILDRMNIIIATLRSLSIFLLEVPMTLKSNYKCRRRNLKSVIFWIGIRKKHDVLIILFFDSRSNGYPFLFIFWICPCLHDLELKRFIPISWWRYDQLEVDTSFHLWRLVFFRNVTRPASTMMKSKIWGVSFVTLTRIESYHSWDIFKIIYIVSECELRDR